ncbi:hypothetical protein CR513_58675, partial [Mucuna pruriens]
MGASEPGQLGQRAILVSFPKVGLFRFKFGGVSTGDGIGDRLNKKGGKNEIHGGKYRNIL